VQSDPNPAFAAHIGKIRHEIEQYGEALISEPELRALSGESSERGQWNVIAAMAITERWSFTFFPNGGIRFAKLASEEQP
jgi:hypothetical protein